MATQRHAALHRPAGAVGGVWLRHGGDLTVMILTGQGLPVSLHRPVIGRQA